MDVSDEEEDEEASAPLPVEGAQEEKEEQGEQQVEGKDINTGSTKWRNFLSPLDRLSVYRYSEGADRRREAAGPALGRLPDLLRTGQQDRGEGSS